MTKENRQKSKYILADLAASAAGWLLFNVYRFQLIGQYQFATLESYLTSRNVVEGQILAPLLWVLLFAVTGYYNVTLLKSRLDELKSTFASVAAGAILFFFAIVIDDFPTEPRFYLHLLGVLFGAEFALVYLVRFLITRRTAIRVHAGEWGYNTLVIGAGVNAARLSRELAQKKQQLGYLIKGYVSTDLDKKSGKGLNIIGSIENLAQLVADNHIEHFIFAPDTRRPSEMYGVISRLYTFGFGIRMYAAHEDVVLGKVRMQALYDEPLVDVSRGNISAMQGNIKRIADVAASALLLVLLSPLYAVLAIVVKLDSPGAVFYRQERLGRWGRPFSIIKFRTMRADAEADGPQLSAEGDTRVTRSGAFMRKYRLDELPQFWNVLKGEMSLVGPRPERACYVALIEREAPHYCLVHQVRPGITSWGMVKYGYASTVEQMVERLRYDMLYLENMSLAVDCKILIYTVRTVLTGQGI